MNGLGARRTSWRCLLRWSLRLAGVMFLLWSLLLLRAVTLMPASLRSPTPASQGHWRGALHVHSDRSDGRANLAEIARHAREAGLDFVMLGDHNIAPPAAQVIDGVLLVPGVELSTADGHVLAYGGTEVAGPSLRRDDPLGAARASGPLVVLAHPVNLRRPWSGPYRGADAMEVISADSAYRSALDHPTRLLLGALAYPGSADVGVLTLLDTFEAARTRFHQALLMGELAQGFCGHDAHGLPAYPPIFRVLRTHLISAPDPGDDPAVAARWVIEQLREGRFFCAVDGLGDAGGFTLEVEEGRVRTGLARAPQGASTITLLLFRDGLEQARVVASVVPGSLETPDGGAAEAFAKLEVEASPGRWHAEAELERPWLLGRRRFLWILSGVRTLP